MLAQDFEPQSGEGRNSGRDVGTEIAQQSEDVVAGGTPVEPHSPYRGMSWSDKGLKQDCKKARSALLQAFL